ncbi:MAG: hypothetical protein FIA91_12370 [Geobacter sp.]|nr:hypothetical protein [Geobacter sp.]
MKQHDRLRLLSRRVYRFGVGVGVVSTIIALLRWFVLDDPNLLPPTIATYVKPGSITMGHRLSGFVIELIPLTPALCALAILYGICSDYCQGILFGPSTGKQYRKLGSCLILLGVANGLYTTLIICVFSLLDNRGLRLAFGLSTSDLYLIVVGSAVAMLGIVMDEAFRIHEENSQII